MADTRTLMLVDEALFEAATTIKIRKKDLLKWPDDDEHLHQYRISVRVARSLVKFLKPYQQKQQNLLLKDALKTLQDPTSRMRELDVLVPLLADYPALQERVRTKQLETRESLLMQLRTAEVESLHALVEDGLKHVHWKKPVRINGIDADALTSRITARRDECEKTLATVDFDDQEAVHDLRKQAKALRYVARELACCLPEGAADVSGQMRKVQDKLGEWCDARVNAALITEICGDAGAELSASFRQQAKDIMEELKAAR
ncbi:MAG: CHAD domain-containing protein [Coriobacteriaceae bacterium]|nr:CHAD domain-containing protein [Coriobacteriaceae bacterium]